jgi:hypothetical protein
METYEDLEMEFDPKGLDRMNTVTDIRKVMSGFTESTRIWVFKTVVSEKPHLINEYKHLVDTVRLKLIIDKYPIIKLYLKD